jgi:pimeloyl-ACP methyl ester carboxylesterase
VIGGPRRGHGHRVQKPRSRCELAVDRWGDGPPVLLLHGIGGSARYWRPLAEVSGGYRATAPDLLGFGRSPKPDHSAYDVQDHLCTLLPLVEPGSVVVAHSTGAVLAAALAAARPDLVSALLLVGAPLYADLPSARTEVRRLGFLARVTASGEVAGRLAMVLMHGLIQPLSPWLPLGLPTEVVEDFWRHSWTSYSRTLRRVVVGHPAVPDLERLSMPCTLLYGARDTTASRQPLAALVAGNCALRHVEAAGGHHLPVQDPRSVADVLEQVLTTALGRGSAAPA